MVRRPIDTRTAGGCGDDGYTLSELMVVIGLLGIVLAIAWNMNNFVTTVSQSNEREAYFSSEVRTPLMYIDKLLMQNSAIEGGSTEYRLSFLTDQNLDDVRERTVVEVSGSELQLTTWEITGSMTSIQPPIRSMRLSDHNANLDLGEPLFTYLDSEDETITVSDEFAGNARSITTNIVVDYQGHVFRDAIRTYLRNRD